MSLFLDIETAIDTQRLKHVHDLTAESPLEIIDEFTKKMQESNKSTFIPWNYHIPAKPDRYHYC